MGNTQVLACFTLVELVQDHSNVGLGRLQAHLLSMCSQAQALQHIVLVPKWDV